jgi:uncharacterized heparinase superfamily protein
VTGNSHEPPAGSGLALLARTAVHVRPGQVCHRARLRAQRACLRRWPPAGRRLTRGPDPAVAAGWPAAFRPVDACLQGTWPGLAELQAGKIRLLGVFAELGTPPDWRQPGAPLLWRFHLHYWDWAWGLAAAGDRLAARALFARLWRSWHAASEFGRGDAWHPYPAALRAWSWCGLHHDLVAGSDFEPQFAAGLAAHAGFLRRHLESDVGGNHLIKGLKAAAGLAVFFADERALRLALRRLARQIEVQVLPDGGHYERAPAYHCQVLADLIDLAGLLSAAGRPAVTELTLAIARMRWWLGAVLSPAGQVPLRGDGYPVTAELVAALRPARPAGTPLLVLPDTGMVRATAGGWHLLADVGAPCPAGLPAHAHADTLGCLVHVDGTPLLVDTGTSTYEPGPVRDYQRSTAAHSTAEVDGRDSTEVWGAFRAGRRARVSGVATHADAAGVTCEASHDGFRALPGRPVHRRRWSLTSTALRVDDIISGRGRHTVTIRWQLAPGCAVQIAAAGARVTTPAGTFQVAVTATRPVTLAAGSRPVAAGYGVTTAAPVLACRADAVLPVRVTTVWSRAGRDTAAGTAA